MKTEWSSRIFSLMLVLGLLMTGWVIVSDDEDSTVEARAGTPNSDGYYWIDSNSPDPRVTYDYKDIHLTGTQFTNWMFGYSYTYTYGGARYYSYGMMNLPFEFSYYGVPQSSVYISTSGKIGFANCLTGTTSANYYFGYFYDYSYDIPYQSYYHTADTVYVYSAYGLGFPEGALSQTGGRYEGAGIFTETFVDPNGPDYMVIQWYKAVTYYYYPAYYGYTNYDVDFEVILYEDGRILCQYKDLYTAYSSSYSNNRMGLMGMSNTNNKAGLQYSRMSYVADRTALLYKQYVSEIVDVELSDGYGPEDTIYPAMGGKGDHFHYVTVDVYSERGLSYLRYLDIKFGPVADGEYITITYDFQGGKFIKNDPMRLMVINESLSSVIIETNSTTNMSVKVAFDYNMWWTYYDPVGLDIFLSGTGVRPDRVVMKDIFKVESRIKLFGKLMVEDSRGEPIPNGGWVSGSESLRFYGITREYYNLGDEIAPPSFIKAGMIDQTGVRYFGETADLDVMIPVNGNYPQMIYKLTLDNVSARQDLTPLELKAEFSVRIDSDLPGIPGDLRIYPDDLNQPPQDYDNDPRVFITWSDAVDASSGVAYYHISVNKQKKDVNPSEDIRVPKGTNAREVTLPEGINRIYMWSEDTVGNQGGEVFITVRIDLTSVYFGDFYPITGEWITNQRPSCSIWINDTNTGVDPLKIEYQISTTGEADLGDQWDLLQETYSPDNSLYIVVTGWGFKNGKNNWMRFRAWDMAGNGPMESPAFNVWIDALPPTYVMKAPVESDYQLNPIQEVKIEVRDPDSGVDFTSIEYRVSTQGRSKFGPWMPYKDATGNTHAVEVRIKQEFARGDQNYIQVRARDLAGNQLSTSQFFNVKINTYPTIVRTSPTPDVIYYEGDVIVFDATGTFDSDGEIPQITWYRNGPDNTLVIFSTIGRMSTSEFDAGDYAITIEAKSGQLTAKEVFTLRVHPREIIDIEGLDSDGDGMPDVWEMAYSTDPKVKDADKDLDGDDFTNFQEYENGTIPLDPRSHPPIPPEPKDVSTLGLFEGDMWLLLIALAILVLAVLITMLVVKGKRDRAEKRIRTVRNMRRIMPSVSWEHITAASYMAAASSQGLMAQASGPALPSGAPVEEKEALPPAPEGVQQAAPAEPVPQQPPF